MRGLLSTKQPPGRISISAVSLRSCSWPRTRAGDRQSVADVRQEIFEIAVIFILRIERYPANLAVAGGKAPADRPHATPVGTVDRHCIEDAERGCQHFGAHPLAGVLHMAGRA